jgi:K+ transporter
LCGVFIVAEASFFSANLTKVAHGAWVPLAVGLGVAFVMVTWRKGREILTANRTPTAAPGMSRWRKALFVLMARNSSSPLEQFRLPIERTVMMGSQVAF